MGKSRNRETEAARSFGLLSEFPLSAFEISAFWFGGNQNCTKLHLAIVAPTKVKREGGGTRVAIRSNGS